MEQQMKENRQTRVRANIERTASNKITRSLTFEHVLGDAVDFTELAADVDQQIALWSYFEGRLVEAGVIEAPCSVDGKKV